MYIGRGHSCQERKEGVIELDQGAKDMNGSTPTQQSTIPWSSLLRQHPRQCSTLQLSQQGWGNYQELSCSLSIGPYQEGV